MLANCTTRSQEVCRLAIYNLAQLQATNSYHLDYARHHPVAQVAVVNVLASLSILQSILSLVLSEIPGFQGDGSGSPFRAFPALQPLERRSEDENVRAGAFAMAIGFTSLVLPLHQEMEHRAAAAAAAGAGATQARDRWEQERADVLRRQVHELAGAAVDDVARALQLLPSVPHLAHIEWSNLQGWAQFILAEADAGVAVTPARIEVFEMYAVSDLFLLFAAQGTHMRDVIRLIAALKLIGYSWDIARASVLIERMEGYVAQHRDPSIAADSALAHLFPLDNSWTGLFGMEYGDESLMFDHFGDTALALGRDIR